MALTISSSIVVQCPKISQFSPKSYFFRSSASVPKSPPSNLRFRRIYKVNKCVLCAASSAAGSSNSDLNPYEVLGVSPIEGFDMIKAAYTKKKKDAERRGDEVTANRLENAYDKIMMAQLTKRKKGETFGSFKVSKDIRYADKQPIVPWGPRFTKSDAKDIKINMAISGVFIAWIFITRNAEWKPLQFLAFAFVYRIFEKLKAFEPPVSPAFTEEGEDEGRMLRMGKRLLRSLSLVFGCVAVTSLVRLGVCELLFNLTRLSSLLPFLSFEITREVEQPHGVGLWKHIRKGWEEIKKGMSLILGNGVSFDFWKDPWCGDLILQEAFPNLYNMANIRDGKVADYLRFQGEGYVWDVQFSRGAQDWELEDIVEFYETLYGQTPSQRAEDKLVWKGTKKGLFTVQSHYKLLTNRADSCFPWKTIWKSKAQPKMAFFAWLAAWNKVLTGDNLKKRGMVVVNRCFMCKEDEETVDHLLLHCPIATTLWGWVFSLVGISWVIPNTVKELLACWRRQWGNNQANVMWQFIPLSLLWHIWGERNWRCFEDTESTVEEMKSLFIHSLKVWMDVMI